MIRFFLSLLLFLSFFPLHSQAGEMVTYKDGAVTLEGYWAPSQCAPPESDPVAAPVVMIVHQWMGLTDNEKMRADMLAAQCYNAFAVDMYGKNIRPKTREEANAQATLYKQDPELARGRMNVALDYVRNRKDPTVDASRVAAIGYCFGGSMVLELARSGADVKGIVSFHGGLSTRAPLSAPGIIKAAVQVHHGAADRFVPQEEVINFMAEMDGADVDWSLTQYAGAVHAFTQKESGDDPTTGVAYNEKADKRSWTATLNFLGEVLGH